MTVNREPWRRVLLAVCMLALLSVGMAIANDDAVVVKAFRIRFAKASNVSTAIQPLLSENGTVTVQPGKRLVTVRDRADIVDRVGLVIADIDVEPESFRLRVQLLSGFNSEVSLPGS